MLLPIFLWQMLWPHIIAQCGGRCYCQVAGGRATVGWVGFGSVLEKNWIYMMSNRMRNLHMHLSTEYGKETVKIFCQWEKYEKKMADFANHRRFTLRCLKEDLVPVSICLTKNTKTPKGLQIIRRAERALLNERVRSINNTINLLKAQWDTCIDCLGRVLNEEWMDRCKEFIEIGREKHYKTIKRQKDKFDRLLQKKQMREGDCTWLHGVHIGNHSNSTSDNNTSCVHDKTKENAWVKNLLSTPLTQVQTSALAHGPNFAVVPRSPPVGEYIVVIENVYDQLQQGKAEELRGEIKSVIKRIQAPKYSITRKERKAIEELRRDKTRIILTVDKGVSMVVMDRDEYNKKAEELLQQLPYRPIPNDPTNKYKAKLISLLKSIKTEGGIDESTYKRLYPTGAGSPNF